METLKIKPGSFLLWKEHSRITKLFSKLFHKELPYNNFSFFLREIELCLPITKGNNNYDKLIILEPKEDYTKEEINLLNSLVIFDANDYFDTVKNRVHYALGLIPILLCHYIFSFTSRSFSAHIV